MERIYKLPLLLEPQGGYTITCPLLPNLITEAETLDEVIPNVTDALAALIEAYEDLNQALPTVLQPLRFCTLVRNLDSCHNSMKYRQVATKRHSCQEIPRHGSGSHRKWYNSNNGAIVPIPDWGP
jgi:antitoxin HicB